MIRLDCDIIRAPGKFHVTKNEIAGNQVVVATHAKGLQGVRLKVVPLKYSAPP